MGRRKYPNEENKEYYRKVAAEEIRKQMLREGKKPSSQNCPRCDLPMEHCGKGRRSVEICNYCAYRA